MCRPSHRRAAIKGPGDFPERRASASLFSLRVFWALNPTAPWLLWATGASLSRRASLSDSAATRGVAPRVHKPNDPIPSQHTLLHSLFSLHLHQPQCLRIISTEHQVHRLNRARSGRRKGPRWGQHLKPFPMPSWTSTAHPSPPPQPTSSAWEGRGRSPPPPLSPQPRGLTSGPD